MISLILINLAAEPPDFGLFRLQTGEGALILKNVMLTFSALAGMALFSADLCHQGGKPQEVKCSAQGFTWTRTAKECHESQQDCPSCPIFKNYRMHPRALGTKKYHMPQTLEKIIQYHGGAR
jgi:hypothetical protein